MHDQAAARERAAAELARRLRHIPPAYLADPDAFARTYWADAAAEGWRHVPRPIDPTGHRPGHADPPNEHWRAARAALQRKDHDAH